MPGIRLERLEKRFGEQTVLHALDLEVAEGSFTVLVGPSGCGKTTTLRLVAGLETPTAGRIRIGDRDVTRLEPRARNVAMVFQNYALYPHMTVYDNMAFGLRARRVPEAEIRRRIARVAAMLGLEALLERRPRQLSGGQQQRVAIGRAIVREPDVFLFDEPLSNLDAKLRVAMRTELRRLQRRLGVTTLYVTHDQEEAMTLGDRIAVMEGGRLLQYGTPREIYFRPADLAVARFVGSPAMNLIEGTLGPDGFRAPDLHLPAVRGPAGRVVLGIRPDDIHPFREGRGLVGPLVARVELVELLGPRAVLTLRLGGRELTAVMAEGEVRELGEGAELALGLDPARLHLFDAASGRRLPDPAPVPAAAG